MRYLFGVPATALIASIALAAPAAADPDEFVRTLQDKYVFLTTEQLMAAGHATCAAARNGLPATDVIDALRDDLGISVQAAFTIVSEAVVAFDC